METDPRGTAPSRRSRVTRKPARARYRRAAVDAILDEALVVHVGLLRDGAPVVVPTLHARIGDHVYVHGSTASPALRALAAGAPACLTATLLDGIVLARSVAHHSANYRSAVVHGRGEPVTEPAAKLAALERFTERLAPGRWAEARPPTERELRGVAVARIALDEASAKVREGPPGDDEADYALPVWAGVVPVALAPGAPVADPRLAPGVELSAAVRALAGA
ncbi:MAG: pyridoxamine 5'-phosphate oxidase family protein [Solirubrobacterales bacterium]|nr:pyridoxamine 5'-phosphate oxidase family protein [Solirubrobacterales bacterium]